jgi:hypothetical protein
MLLLAVMVIWAQMVGAQFTSEFSSIHLNEKFEDYSKQLTSKECV